MRRPRLEFGRPTVNREKKCMQCHHDRKTGARRAVRSAVLTAALLTAFSAAEQAHADGLAPITGAIGETKVLADARVRFESVDQEPFAAEASAATLRARLGFETGKAWSTALLDLSMQHVSIQA
jgi:hypothetical protein